jgi:hypothetical protein
MEDSKIKCPFCNFETAAPIHGKILDCAGECYATYTRMRPDDIIQRVKMKLAEIFFLDEEYNIKISIEELDEKCEFVSIPAGADGETFIFARERRPSIEEIESLRDTVDDDAIVGMELMERLDSSIDRFKRDLRYEAPPDKIHSDIKAIEAVLSIFCARIERKQ